MFLQSIYKTMMSRPHPRIVTPNSTLFPIVNSVSADLYAEALKHTQYLRCEDLKILQEKRLNYLISSARNIHFYKERLENFRDMNDFEKITPVTKNIMRLELEKGRIYNPYYNSFRVPQFTSGSTGIPFQFYLDSNMFCRRRAVYRRMLQWAGRTSDDLVVSLMPKLHPGLESETTFLQCNDPSDVEKVLPRIYKIFKHKSIVLQSRKSHLTYLAKFLEKDKISLNFKALISYTEELQPEIRSYLERIYGAPVFNYYACNEMTAIAQECKFRSGLHVNNEWVYVEILDAKNKPVPPGEKGQVVVTALDNEVMPFIRYKLGDVGYWVTQRCPCGRTLPKINIYGRKDNSFLLPNGRTGYFATLMWPLVQRINKIFQYQVVRHSIKDFVINITPTPEFNKSDIEFIIARFKEYIDQAANISLNVVDRIETTPSGKELAFINLLPDTD